MSLLPSGYFKGNGYVTVEPRPIYASTKGVYGSAKDCIQVFKKSACMQSEGRSYTVGKGFIVVVFLEDMITIGSQPIV